MKTGPLIVNLRPHTRDVLQEWIAHHGERGYYRTEDAAGLALALADLIAADAGRPPQRVRHCKFIAPLPGWFAPGGDA